MFDICRFSHNKCVRWSYCQVSLNVILWAVICSGCIYTDTTFSCLEWDMDLVLLLDPVKMFIYKATNARVTFNLYTSKVIDPSFYTLYKFYSDCIV